MGRVSKLHKYTLDKINSKFPHLKTRENYYPEWLTSSVGARLELDIFIDELNIAAEVQGDQHFSFTPFFHSNKEDFENQKKRDEHKRYVCRKQGIKFYEIITEKDADIMIYEISEMLDILDKNKGSYFYQEQTISNRKFRKLFKHTDPEIINERKERARKKLELWESGKIEATEEKVSFWRELLA